jgi:hypothetical protein
MDPQLKSVLTTVAGYVATGIAAWAASKGLIPSADQTSFANDIVMIAAGAAAAALAWYKSRSHTPTAQIAAVNEADNGVKVVPVTAMAASVDHPLKGPESKPTVVDQKS